MNLLGRHNIANVLAAAGAALELGCELETIRRGLSKLQPVSGRGCPRQGLNGALVIDDSYNANPASVMAAIDLLVDLGGFRVLVLGDMGELGEWEQQSHREVGLYAREKGVDALYAVGTLSALSFEAFGQGAQLFDSKAALIAALRNELNANVRVLVKGSRTAGMDEVVAGLVTDAETDNNKHKAS